MNSPLFVSYVHPQIFSSFFPFERTACFMLSQWTDRPGLKKKGMVDARKPNLRRQRSPRRYLAVKTEEEEQRKEEDDG
jgi:hypothetical protein